MLHPSGLHALFNFFKCTIRVHSLPIYSALFTDLLIVLHSASLPSAIFYTVLIPWFLQTMISGLLSLLRGMWKCHIPSTTNTIPSLLHLGKLKTQDSELRIKAHTMWKGTTLSTEECLSPAWNLLVSCFSSSTSTSFLRKT